MRQALLMIFSTDSTRLKRSRSRVRIPLVLSLLALILTLAVPASGSKTQFGPVATKPPRAVLENQMESRLRTARGSFCSEDGCVDKVDPTTDQVLRATHGSQVKIFLKVPASRVSLQVLGGSSYAPAVVEPSVDQPLGSVWSFTVPQRPRKTRDIILFVEYQDNEDGLIDAFFGGRIAPRTSSSG